MPEASLTPIARALGRIPSGLFIVATHTPRGPVGFVASFVMQMGFEPPTVAVAVGKERGPLAALRDHGHFAISVLDAKSGALMAPFFKSEEPFEDLALEPMADGSPALAEALAWVGCRIVSEHETGDHVVLFGEVTEARLAREGDPSIHTRKNGLSY